MKTYISILLLLGATIFSFAQVKISDEAISAVTPGITLEVDGKVHIAGASTSTGTGATGTDKVLMRDNTGVIKMAKPEYYSTQMFVGNYILSGTKYVSTGNFNTIIDVATTNTFNITSETDFVDRITISNCFGNKYGSTYIAVPFILILENIGTGLVETQINNFNLHHNGTVDFYPAATIVVAKRLLPGNYRYKLQVRKVAPQETSGDYTVDFSNTTMSYARSQTSKIAL